VELSPLDEAILTALAEFLFPFSSVRELSRRICLPRSTVHRHRHLRQSLRFTARHLGWIPHFLTAEQKQIRVQMAIETLQVLSVQSTRQWHEIVTLDELWIYLFNEYDLMWTAPREIGVDREWHTVQSPKFMLVVVWNPIRSHVPCSDSPPEGTQIRCTILYNIMQMISWSQSQIGGGRPGNTAEEVIGAF
jgi:hypothetical protein